MTQAKPGWGLGLTWAEIEQQCPTWIDKRFWPQPVNIAPPDLEASAPSPDHLAAHCEPPDGYGWRLEFSASQTGGK